MRFRRKPADSNGLPSGGSQTGLESTRRRRRPSRATIVSAAAMAAGLLALGVHEACGCSIPQFSGGGTTGSTTGGGGGGYAGANLYVNTAANGGTTTCAPSGSFIDYATALAQNRVCSSLWKACQQATGGYTVGVKAADYPLTAPGSPLPNNDDGFAGPPYGSTNDGDCSKGLGNDVNPNSFEQTGTAVATPTNWVTFNCADGNTSNANFALTPNAGNVYFYGNNHAKIEGGCFHFAAIFVGDGGFLQTYIPDKNLILRGTGPPTVNTGRISTMGVTTRGGMNFAFYHLETPYFVWCTQNGNTSFPVNKWCRFDVTNEAIYANEPNGSIDNNNAQFRVGKTSSQVSPPVPSHASINVRFDDYLWHDFNTKDNGAWHTSCFLLQDNNGLGGPGETINSNQNSNVVIDGLHCYRVAAGGIQSESSGGLTIQNSSIGVASDSLDQSCGNGAYTLWFCAAVSGANYGITLDQKGGAQEVNDLIRYNSMPNSIELRPDLTTAGYSNVRIIGNIVQDGYDVCTQAGITMSFNTYVGAKCSADAGGFATTPNPFTVDSRTSLAYPPTQGQIDTVGFDAHLTGAAGSKPFERALPTTGDFALPYDGDGNPRPAAGQSANTAGAFSR